MSTSFNPTRPGHCGRWVPRTLWSILVLLVVSTGVFYWRPFWVVDRLTNAGLRLAGVTSSDVRLGACRIHYLVGGKGKPLVLVHGLGGKAQDWAPMIPSLMRRGYRVYALDLLGFGKSDRPDVDYSITLQTQILRQFFNSQRITQADLGGWSMGGWVALEFTLAHPELVRRLFVYDSAGIYFTRAFDPALFHPATVEQAQEFLGWLTPQASRIPRFFMRDMIREMRPEAWVVDRAMKSMATGADLLDGKLQGIQEPVLIAWGQRDILIPLACGAEMHREMPQSLFEVFDGCGHLAPVECVNRILPQTIRFLEAQPPLPAGTREIPQ